MTADLENIRQNLIVLLSTAPGERVNLPTYGAGLEQFVFRPPTQALLAEISEVVAAAIRLWEPRIELVDVLTSFDAASAGLVLIEVQFLVPAIGTPSNLVFPFAMAELSPGATG
ncbi:MAG TPA: GPW/gp25 family protein [Allosphingosinicella sp.]|nr:GPW/gp25 family protein [Allosphingosinicella sp.]